MLISRKIQVIATPEGGAHEILRSDLCRKLQLVGIGMNRDCISKIENGDRFVADFEVITMAEVLEVPVLWLLGIE